MSFIHDDFLLRTPLARKLYHDHAAPQPIIDYYCQLKAADIARDRRFSNLWEIWLDDDACKWRLMRANGVPEKFCSGDADPYDKFLAWARTVPHTLRHPSYHWTHLELARYFGITTLLNEDTAPAIWEAANERLKSPELSARGILRKFRVQVVATAQDPTDTLEHHKALSAEGCETRLLPAFCPDAALRIENPDTFKTWVRKLSDVSNGDCASLPQFLAALRKRHDYFHALGGRLSDHAPESFPFCPCSEPEAAALYAATLSGKPATPVQCAQFMSFLMIHVARLDSEKAWTQQWRLGALRHPNTRLARRLGADAGTDTIGAPVSPAPLAAYFDTLDQQDALPKTLLHNLNPADSHALASLLGSFQEGALAGKLQYGVACGPLPHATGIKTQLDVLSTHGLLSRSVGMATGSRSFMSLVRHEYYRRTLCDLLAQEVEAGLLPDHPPLLADLVTRLSYTNAAQYFGYDLRQG